MSDDRVAHLKIEASIADAIEKVLEKFGDDGVYWHCDGLVPNMAKAAILVLTTTSAAAEWGKKNI
jgi:hypothetical protein